MAGPNLEVFKFAVYLFFPLGMMVHYGKPEWYTHHVVPYRDRLFPPAQKTVKDMPFNQTEIRNQLERLKAEKLAKRSEREEKQRVEERLV